MEITKTFYPSSREKWRTWLRKNHNKIKEIWLVYYSKKSNKPCVKYAEAVEEALCFGWIDSTMKKINDEKFAQRFTPRKTKSPWSELNKERARRLIKSKKMTKAGTRFLPPGILKEKFTVPIDILKAIRADTEAWKHFQKFPVSYKRIRIGFISNSRNRPLFFNKRLEYFIKMTRQNKRFGSMK